MADTVKSGNPTFDLVAGAFLDAQKTDFQKVAIAAGAYIALTAVTLMGFELIRSNNKAVYEPKRKYPEPGKPDLPPISYSPFAWMGPVWRLKEADLLPLIGLDAVTFLRFLRMTSLIATALAVVLCGVLIPVDVAWHFQNPGSRSFLTAISISGVSGNAVWAHVVMSYVATAIVLFLIYVNYRHMVRLRWEWFRSEQYQNAFFARTIMLTNVPSQLRSDAALQAMLASIGMPYPTTEVHIGRVVGALPDLIDTHDETVRKLESVLARYLKNPNRVASKRPMISVGGSMGVGKQKVDAIDHYVTQINKLEAAIDTWRQRIAEKKPESYGFASLASVPYAHAAARSLVGKKQKGVTVTLAPQPHDVLWKNLTLTKAQRTRSSLMGLVWLSLLFFVNAVPLLGVALIAQMTNFTGVLPFLGAWQRASSWSFSAVAGLAPPAISGLMGFFMPVLMRRIAKYRGVTTRTKQSKVLLSQYFAFLIISQFVIFTLIGAAFTIVGSVLSAVNKRQSVGSIFGQLGKQTPPLVEQTYIIFSNYWLTWLPLRGWIAFFDLAQLLKLMLVWFQKGFLGRTPRDVREYTRPPHFDYAFYYANLLFVFAVAMLYACLTPLVVVFSAAVLWISYLTYKYMLMYVFATKVETGGALWRVVVNRLLVCLIFMQVILALVLVLQGSGGGGYLAWIRVVASLPPVVVVLLFKGWCRRNFDGRFDWYIPSAEELANCKVHTGDVRHHRLMRRFGHPALHQPLFTPMVHARVKHLLPQVFRGKLEAGGLHDVEGRKVEMEEVAGGLKIAAIEEDQLEYDPRLDSDSRSVMSSSTMGLSGYSMGPGGPPSRQGTAQFQQYYAGAKGGMDDIEMRNVEARSSRDYLLDRTHVSRQSDATLMGSALEHAKKPSGGSMGWMTGSPHTTPGLEMPATGSGQGRPATGSDASRSRAGTPASYFPPSTLAPPPSGMAAYAQTPAPGYYAPGPARQPSQGSLNMLAQAPPPMGQPGYAGSPGLAGAMYGAPQPGPQYAQGDGGGGYFSSSPQGSPHVQAANMYGESVPPHAPAPYGGSHHPAGPRAAPPPANYGHGAQYPGAGSSNGGGSAGGYGYPSYHTYGQQ